jgi:hypothetical protein
VKPAKDMITRLGNDLGEHLCRYLILSGRQLGLITSAENEADLYKRWLKARIMRTAIKHTPRQIPALEDTPQRSQAMQYIPQQPVALQDTPQWAKAMPCIPQQPPTPQETQGQVTLKPQSQYQHEASPSYFTPVSLDGWNTAQSSATPVETTPPLTLSSGTTPQASPPYDPAFDTQDTYWTADAQIVEQNGAQDFDFCSDFLACDPYEYEVFTH